LWVSELPSARSALADDFGCNNRCRELSHPAQFVAARENVFQARADSLPPLSVGQTVSSAFVARSRFLHWRLSEGLPILKET
jgi:hypothetical protein